MKEPLDMCLGPQFHTFHEFGFRIYAKSLVMIIIPSKLKPHVLAKYM